MDIFLHNTQEHVWRTQNTTHEQKTPHTKCQAWWWRGDDFWLVLQQQDLDTFQSLCQPQTSLFTKYARVKCEAICPAAEVFVNWVTRQNNDTKQSCKYTKKWLKQKRNKVLQWPVKAQTSIHKKMLWQDLKRLVCKVFPTNFNEFKWHCKEKETQISL